MSELNPAKLETTNMKFGVPNFNVKPAVIDGINSAGETRWDNKNFKTYLGYYRQIPELKAAVKSLANWTVGKGYDCDEGTRVTLSHITGSGEDTFRDIMWNMLVIKIINGDAYAEIIRDKDSGEILNLKPLDPSSMVSIFNEQGRIIRYEQIAKSPDGVPVIFKPNQMLHLMHDRIADEIHGTSAIEACRWVIDARNEAMSDKRRILHRSTIRVMEVDTDDTTKYTTIKNQYAEAIKNGEVLLLPKGNYTFPDVPPMIHDSQEWIQYLENFFYIAINVPKAALGGSSSATEASAKVDLVSYDQAWNTEQTRLEDDLFNQMGIILKWIKASSLMDNLNSNEQKNTGQLGFQQNDVQGNAGKTNMGVNNA